MPHFTPTPEQSAILKHDCTHPACVLAGPGTGKSATLVALVDQLLHQRPGTRLRLLTFTRAATAELGKKVSDHPAAATQRPSTIHSFAISVLLKNPGSGNLPQPLRIADKWEEQHVLWPTLARRVGVHQSVLRRLIHELASNWESLRPDTDRNIDENLRARFLGAWHEHRLVYAYTLLAELPYALLATLQEHPDTQGVDYAVIVVDEYQDLNACDLAVLKLLADRGCSIIAAGDDDQSIYAFRRAAPEGIRRFPQDYPDATAYPLSLTQRCGARIIEWANYVIAADPDRPRSRPLLQCPGDAPPGETALLAFQTEQAEAAGIGALVANLTSREGLSPSDVLVLLRADHHGVFSRPIKEQLAARGIPVSDPDSVDAILDEAKNRRTLQILRLLTDPHDSLAWAGLLNLTDKIGTRFSTYIYERARAAGIPFGRSLLSAHEDGFPDAPASSKRAKDIISAVLAWLDEHPLPIEENDSPIAWGRWILTTLQDGSLLPTPPAEFQQLLLKLDQIAEPDQSLGRYLAQLRPLGRDLAMAESAGVRIMTMASAKGLTVQATIVAAVEEGIIPHPDANRAEERRLLYVAMTRPKRFLYATWTRRRKGPTARSGVPGVGTMRTFSTFLRHGPVPSQDGAAYLSSRWP